MQFSLIRDRNGPTFATSLFVGESWSSIPGPVWDNTMLLIAQQPTEITVIGFYCLSVAEISIKKLLSVSASQTNRTK